MARNDVGKCETRRLVFDMHEFMPNKRLQSMAEAVGKKYDLSAGYCELSDDEPEVWAAGDTASGYMKVKINGEADEYE